MKILYIGNPIHIPQSGGDQINKRNLTALQKISDNLIILPLQKRVSIFDKIFFYIGGNKRSLEQPLLKLIAKEKPNYVFLSISQIGRLSYRIKSKFPGQKIICFFHNIEVQYAHDLVRVSGFKHILFYLAVKYNERLAVRWSDFKIVLNSRDAILLNRIYKKNADLILPTSLPDSFDIKSVNREPDSSITYLFVGVAFFANIEGIKWFIKNVLPYIPGTLIIVGKGMEQQLGSISSDKIHVLGFVKDLSDLYYKATFIISPILSGGGMKTKTAEALMYGKTIIGTPEAFEGYKIIDKAMYVCKTANDFIDTINSLIKAKKTVPFNSESRKLFMDSYSEESTISQLNSFFKRIL